ncbi:peptide chain release factor N(5)-glutamine methyltransferase [Candidatus Peregrinibacteria bacterium]|nr:peptide chain release factor N(5)-glutamine methyltransferase [Candidatus Peregrinibacteria bacterium]
MTVEEALAGTGLPSSDAEIMLANCLNNDRAWIMAHGMHPLSAIEWKKFTAFAERRRRHEPVAYIIGKQEFYGREFAVDSRVLIPRPATEGVVRRTLQFLSYSEDALDEVDDGIIVTAKKLKVESGKWKVESGKWKITTIVDVGTGSGCIAVTLALERTDMKIIATDVSSDALEIARMNAERHGVLDRITFKEGGGLDPVRDLAEPFLLVSNPPYIPDGRLLMADVREYEPHLALFGGPEGNEIAADFIRQAESHPMCAGFVMELPRRTSQVRMKTEGTMPKPERMLPCTHE